MRRNPLSLSPLRITIAAIGVLWIAPCAYAQETSDQFTIEFRPTPSDSGFYDEAEPVWRFPARVDRPDPAHANGVGVMLFAGGLANDIDWTTPGSVEQDGTSYPFTPTGEEHRDGELIARSLVRRGFTVMRYASIREGDPLAAESPGMAQAMTFAGTMRLARQAWSDLCDRAGLPAQRVIVLGHSLGAPRGILASDGDALGYVLIAGAYTSKTRTRPSQASAAALARLANGEIDLDTDQQIEVDADADGELSGWELAAYELRTDDSAPDSFRDEPREPWPSDVLLDCGAPVLAIWGSLDSTSMHGPRLAALLPEKQLTTRYFTRLGHNLGEERPAEPGGLVDSLTGPIDPAVVELVGEWCDSLAD